MSELWQCIACDGFFDPSCGPHACSDQPRPRIDASLQGLAELIVNARLRRLAERLRVPHGGLVPDAEVYVRAMLVRVIEEELEER